MAIKSGTATAPFWVAYLDMAEAWGWAPWEIFGGTPVEWIIRYQVRRRIQVEVTADQYKDIRKRGRKT